MHSRCDSIKASRINDRGASSPLFVPLSLLSLLLSVGRARVVLSSALLGCSSIHLFSAGPTPLFLSPPQSQCVHSQLTALNGSLIFLSLIISLSTPPPPTQRHQSRDDCAPSIIHGQFAIEINDDNGASGAGQSEARRDAGIHKEGRHRLATLWLNQSRAVMRLRSHTHRKNPNTCKLSAARSRTHPSLSQKQTALTRLATRSAKALVAFKSFFQQGCQSV